MTNLDILEGQDTKTLCRWGCDLNHWRWPKDMPGKPKGFDFLVNYAFDTGCPDKHRIISPYITRIKEMVGEREFRFYHWTKYLRKKAADFEVWWQEEYNNV